MAVACSMKLQFILKDGKIQEITIPEGSEIHRAIVWTSKGDKNEVTKVIIIPDNVESVEVLKTETV